MHPSEACQLLEWDSSFFSLRIGRVKAGELTRELLGAIEREAGQRQLDCLYFLAEPDRYESLALALHSGFRLVDVRTTLDLRALQQAEIAEEPLLRNAEPADSAALRAIARISHRDSRFYQDPHFPRARCDALYETWIDNSLAGWADAVLISEQDGMAAGYVTCRREDHGEGAIGLLGVEPRAQGAGHGARLVRGALAWLRAAGCARATVVTQGCNIRAQRLYQRCGFKTARVQLWLHRWFGPQGPEPEGGRLGLDG